MASYLDRYLQGEREQVWAELLAQGARVREEPLAAEAWAVARETMRRVRHNIETLIPRLTELGYEFGYRWAAGSNFPSGSPDPVFAPPAPNVADVIAKLERRVGVLPLSLRAFYEHVGAVNFVGRPPESWINWRESPSGLDALYVYSAEIALEDAESWQDRYGDLAEDEWGFGSPYDDEPCDARAYHALPHDCWLVPIAPDIEFKYDISGCGAYEIATPNPAADARLLMEEHRTTFVSYLRFCFTWAGIPGLDGTTIRNRQRLAYLRDGLLPI